MKSKIYLGEVTHTRLIPVEHQFRYTLYFYAFALEELPSLARRNPLFGYNRLRPVAIHDRDYLTPGEAPMREKLEAVLHSAGLGGDLGEVVLVTAARYFNYIFNPISFFYCYDSAGRLFCVLAQVNNTFGEMHLYPMAVGGHDPVDGARRLQVDKRFHVSPFFPRRGHYEFRVTDPGTSIDNIIRYHVDDQLSLVARIHGRARTLTPAALGRTLVSHPLCASLTMPRILWQAARLHWQRRLPVYSKPVPDSALTVRSVPPRRADRLGMALTLKFLSRIPQGELVLTTPDGREHRFGEAGSEPALDITVKEYRFFRRVMVSGDIGFGEAFTDGEWTTSDLPGLLTHLALHESVMDDRSIVTSAVGRTVNFLRHLLRPNTVRGSARNIGEHYDLSNDFFATFLDATMTYSGALFRSPEDSLEQAQRHKLHCIMEKAGVTAEDHVLEIGCGWGSFAIEAARTTGCRVTGITVSREQLELARQRVAEAGLQDRVEIRYCDYRHVRGSYSKIVSIEMLEAVGHAGLGAFFAACDRVLHPGGRAVVQVITIPDRKYAAYRYSSDWIRKHIFPGGHLPSVGALARSIGRHSTLNIVEIGQSGRHYAHTLDCWTQLLTSRREEVLQMGYDDAFMRKWLYYFAYCRAGFAAQIIDLTRLVLDRPQQS
ncbi:MAG: DUF1365 family protein [Desulfuromonadales bacterium]|nr:DUF1365 family protein [Desulfuromonadales bacterium]NIS44383.1 DUF1365 family protein [Desulfuromonadales bacterium]